MRITLLVFATLLFAAVWSVGVAAVYFSNLQSAPLRHGVAGLFALAGVVALVFLRRRRRVVAWLAIAWAAAMLWHGSIRPSNDRDWTVDVAVLPDATIDGDEVRVVNVRNFEYRALDDFDVRYEDRTYDLAKLRAMDLIVCYWEGDDVAHTMVSFDFDDSDPLCLSVEARRENGEEYGVLAGAFKQFETIYVLADERDAVRLRTNLRQENVFLYRTKLTPDDCRQLLVRVLERVHELHTKPEFYHSIANNCTTSLVGHINSAWPDRTPFTKQIFMNGRVPEMAFDSGSIASELPFEEYKLSCNINVAAQVADNDPDFSRRIRDHL